MSGRAKGEVELERVSFGSLSELSLRIPAGACVALIGGAEIVALVTGRRRPDSGRVLIDGGAWVVGPRTDLVAGTVAENIAYGTAAAREQVVGASKGAGAHSFVSELPEHYDTSLGEGGVALSGGQRQRIGIARALLRDPPIVVLEEPTHGLDPLSEARVVDGLRVLMRGRTTILVTRSPALASIADRVVVLEDGRVVRDGPPQSLLEHRARRAGAPLEDPALPALGRLLDAEAMAPVLRRGLEPGAPLPDVRVKYLRYKPGTNLVALYNVGVDGSWHDVVVRVAAGASMAKRAVRPANLALAAKAAPRSPAREPLAYDPELGALIQWLPLDLNLPALAEDPEVLAAELLRHGVEAPAAEPAVLSYRPRRRAVLRLGDHVLKIYASADDFERAIAALRTGSLVRVPIAPFEAALPELRLTAQELLRGSPPPHDPATVMETAQLVRELHGSGVDGFARLPPRAQLDAAAASARLAGVLLPELVPRLAGLLERLESTLPEAGPLVPSHGDFHARQVLRDGGALALIDFDRMCLAPAAFDLGNYAAHFLRGDDGEMELARAALAALALGYGERPPGLDWYLATAILRRVPFPFRYLDDHWPRRVRAMTAAAESALVG